MSTSEPEPIVISKKKYLKEEERLQGELVALQEWIRTNGKRLVVIFEGRDTAGKGGTIKRITARLNPRTCHVVALPARPNASGGSGTSSATSRACRRLARW